MQTFYKTLIASLLLAIPVLTGTSCAKSPGAGTPEHGNSPSRQQLIELVSELNKGLPQDVDSATQLRSVSLGPGTGITYHLSLLSVNSTEIDKEKFKSLMEKKRIQVCNDQDSSKLIGQNIALKYEYLAKDGVPVGDFLAQKSSCL